MSDLEEEAQLVRDLDVARRNAARPSVNSWITRMQSRWPRVSPKVLMFPS
jgi:hypothetical protein